jgi:DNA invertase Pin-like site-specific DNA recombinase
MIYGYARVSTESQNLGGQIETLKKAHVDTVYCEKMTGTNRHRPVLMKLLRQLKAGDTLTVTKLDRLARNTNDALHIIQQLFNKNVTFNNLNMGIIDNTPTGKLIFTVLSAFSQFERDMIVSRTMEGKAYAKKHKPNFTEGRPRKYSDEEIRMAYRMRCRGMTYQAISQQSGISIRTLRRRFTELEQRS